MPIFEYKCQNCSLRFEELVLSSKQSEPGCPQCGGADVERLISTFAAKAGGDGASSAAFTESSAPLCGSCGVPGPCAIN
jgi:putative FmdB family regulatory protein